MTFIAETDLLDQVDGSATFEFAGTKVIASVAGPLEISRSRFEKPTQAYIDINIRPAIGVGSTRETLMESKLRNILTDAIEVTQYPRQMIQVVVQILKTGESADYTVKEMVAIVNGMYLSLINSGVALKNSFLATCCSISKQNKIILRPTEGALERSVSHHLVVFIDGDLELLDSKGSFTKKQVLQVIGRSKEDVSQLKLQMRDVITNRLEQDYLWST